MTFTLEDALYDFIDTAEKPFTAEEAARSIALKDVLGSRRLVEEIAAMISSRKLAFPFEGGRWISRRAIFEARKLAILPSRLEIQNGILIPGHRCIPFANPLLYPHELSFRWKGEPIPRTTSEAAPEELYPYYDLYGEEYAPQYLARDNRENEDAFNADPYVDPPEVSIQTLDMRAIYREVGFVPGDRFVATAVDWKGGLFELEKVGKDAWSGAELEEWKLAAESGFFKSFDILGPGATTEEQIAFACFYGGERVRTVPAYAMEEFLYEKTDRIETVNYGMESRFWKAGKEIPDAGPWTENAGPPDKTEIEAMLAKAGLPISEYVIEAYVRDAFFRKNPDIAEIYRRLVPESIPLAEGEGLFLARFIQETIEDFEEVYNYFQDKEMGPLRQRVAELHTAVVDLVAKISMPEVNPSWLPRHAFVSLSQLQIHAANLLEDLDYDEPPEDSELETMGNSLDGMIDSYTELKDAIEESLDEFRRSRLSIVREADAQWRALQFSISGTTVWRRILVPEGMNLEALHRIIQAALGWSGDRLHGFVAGGQVYGPSVDGGELSEASATIASISRQGLAEMRYDYDYGSEWELKINLLNPTPGPTDGIPRCLAGEGAAPTETCGGALRFRRFVTALKGAPGAERDLALSELGQDFDADEAGIPAANRRIEALFSGKMEERNE